MYTEEFKNKVIESFKQCPYFKTISRKYGIERETLKRWLREKNINVEEEKTNCSVVIKPFKQEPREIGNIEMYETVLVVETKEDDSKEKIEFELNGFNIKIATSSLKKFIRGMKND